MSKRRSFSSGLAISLALLKPEFPVTNLSRVDVLPTHINPRSCGTTGFWTRSRPGVLGLAQSACLNAPVEETQFGVFRM